MPVGVPVEVLPDIEVPERQIDGFGRPPAQTPAGTGSIDPPRFESSAPPEVDDYARDFQTERQRGSDAQDQQRLLLKGTDVGNPVKRTSSVPQTNQTDQSVFQEVQSALFAKDVMLLRGDAPDAAEFGADLVDGNREEDE